MLLNHFEFLFVLSTCIKKEISTGQQKPDNGTEQYRIITPKTVNVRIDKKFETEKEQMKKDFESVKYFCATADIWSTKRKSFMGVTVHWVDAITLERRSKVLCCRRFASPHDSERIAELLSSVYDEFNIKSKVICTVTDNAANFVKAFKDFGISLETFTSFIASCSTAQETENDDSGTENPFLDDDDDFLNLIIID